MGVCFNIRKARKCIIFNNGGSSYLELILSIKIIHEISNYKKSGLNQIRNLLFLTVHLLWCVSCVFPHDLWMLVFVLITISIFCFALKKSFVVKKTCNNENLIF